MFSFGVLLLSFLVNDVCGQCDTVTGTLLEELMSVKDELAQVKLDIQELQLTSDSCTCDDSANSNSGSNGTAFGQLQWNGGGSLGYQSAGSRF